MLDAATELYGVWGHPIDHSFSPLIHNRAFAERGINAAYAAFDVHPQELPEAVAGARALGLKGWNLTVPHKQSVLPLLDMVDPLAARIGAVNTVRFAEGRLEGFNTDGIGFLGPLVSRTPFVAEDAKVALIGAGGATRAVAFTLADAGAAEIHIFNRTAEKARELAAAVHDAYGFCELDAHHLEEPLDHPALAEVDLIVQCTSRGLGNSPPVALEWDRAAPGAVVADLVYGTGPTPFLRAASDRGHTVFDGLWMLLGQAAEAFRLWTGRPFGLDRAHEWVREALQARAGTADDR